MSHGVGKGANICHSILNFSEVKNISSHGGKVGRSVLKTDTLTHKREGEKSL